jgi:predicted DNA-binding protein
MAKKMMRNFHVPLPQELYNKLRNEAKERKQPATQIVRLVLENWFKQREQELLHQQIAAWASENAGSSFDLDEQLEEASVEHLLQKGKTN